jgi:hypothetical protein
MSKARILCLESGVMDNTPQRTGSPVSARRVEERTSHNMLKRSLLCSWICGVTQKHFIFQNRRFLHTMRLCHNSVFCSRQTLGAVEKPPIGVHQLAGVVLKKYKLWKFNKLQILKNRPSGHSKSTFSTRPLVCENRLTFVSE